MLLGLVWHSSVSCIVTIAFFCQGILPLDYLGGTDQFKAEAMFANARQMIAQFEVSSAVAEV